jgi:uncharacterized protein (DUF39 family)
VVFCVVTGAVVEVVAVTDVVVPQDEKTIEVTISIDNITQTAAFFIRTSNICRKLFMIGKNAARKFFVIYL